MINLGTVSASTETAKVSLGARLAHLVKNSSKIAYFIILITPIILFVTLLPILMLVSLLTG
jgi:hypothetical protein